MQSTSHQGPFPDRPREQRVPTTEDISSSDTQRSSHPNRDAVSEQTWKPSLDRRQSWSNQDRKHQLQERLMSVDKGQERGFTETGHGN